MSPLLIVATLAATAGTIPVVHLDQAQSRPAPEPSCAIQGQRPGRAIECRLQAGADVQTLVLQLVPEPAACRPASKVVVMAREARPAAPGLTVEDGLPEACRR